MPEPLVGVIMGSDSDWPVMSAAAEALAEFAVPYEVGVYSAHRTPQRMLDYATSAAGRGLRVIVAGAGGAAHLPGMVAAATPLPVIGVPVPLKVLDGLDSLLSIVQMPAGVPVATVAVGGARNAGLLAVRILAAADEGLRARMQAFQASLQATVLEKDAALRGERAAAPLVHTEACTGAARAGPDRGVHGPREHGDPRRPGEFAWRAARRRDVGWRYTGEEVVLS